MIFCLFVFSFFFNASTNCRSKFWPPNGNLETLDWILWLLLGNPYFPSLINIDVIIEQVFKYPVHCSVMKDHVKDPSVFDICPISTNNSSDATHYKRRTQYQQNNVWIAIQIYLALYTYNLNINHQWLFYTCVTICNMDLYIIKKKGRGLALTSCYENNR